MSGAGQVTVLDTVYAQLPDATTIPEGRYKGVLPFGFDGLWDGKEFDGDMVWNLLGRKYVIRGRVMLSAGQAVIKYSHGSAILRDFLKPLGDGWLGYFDLRGTRVYFALVRE